MADGLSKWKSKTTIDACIGQITYGDGFIRNDGRLTDTEMRCYLYAADIFAFPSIDRREAFGVALAEALYCGTPAVTFRINGSGVTWVNQDKKTGIIVDEIDEKHYAEALNVLLADEALRIQYGQTAQEWVRAHFLKNRIDSLSELYDQC